MIRDFAIFQKTPEKLTISLEEMLANKDFFQCLVAETAAGEIVGFATFFFVYYSWSGKALYLDDLFITQSFRRRNIGSKLLEAITTIAKSEHCKKMRWQVSKWNAAGIDFYKKIGALVDEVEVNCDLLLTTT